MSNSNFLFCRLAGGGAHVHLLKGQLVEKNGRETEQGDSPIKTRILCAAGAWATEFVGKWESMGFGELLPIKDKLMVDIQPTGRTEVEGEKQRY